MVKAELHGELITQTEKAILFEIAMISYCNYSEDALHIISMDTCHIYLAPQWIALKLLDDHTLFKLEFFKTHPKFLIDCNLNIWPEVPIWFADQLLNKNNKQQNNG